MVLSEPVAQDDLGGIHVHLLVPQQARTRFITASGSAVREYCSFLSERAWVRASRPLGRVLYHPSVQLGGELMDLAGQLRVGFELQFLLIEVVIRLGLLE